ncbi:glucose-6-phosphate isomerase [hydrocarbon metagenome]|uniref:Glucose-6-phosphate isomerase n=1 Tax=hydrocarbon metagenome TaxID=938273 RepID=A0A0W8FQ98_9ZZZZ
MDNEYISFSLGIYQDSIIGALDAIRRDDIIGRIWAKDHTVWKSSPVEIADRLDWLDAPQETLEKVTYIRQSLEPFFNGSINDAVLLGMGGSILAAEVFNKIFGSEAGYPNLHIVDTTDPILISRITKRLNLEKTLFLVSSKSGKTMEVTSLFHYFYNLVLNKLGDIAASHFIIITDKGSALEDLSRKLSIHQVFSSNSNIGGRYSALSVTGIVPAAIIGIDVEILLLSAIDALQREKPENFSGEFSATGTVLGATMGTLAREGRNKITFIMSPQWASFGMWLEQLIAESTGKEGKGILPVLDEPLADPCFYGNDRLFVFIQNASGDNSEKIEGLIEAGHPVITITTNNRYNLGGLMFLWEMATAIAGHFLGINPFDQPDVEITKAHTRRMIALYREHKELPYELPSLSTPECVIYGGPQVTNMADKLKLFISEANKDDYVCLQVYLNQSPEIDETLKNLRETIFIKYGLAVTIGYGPRYLHSTGQLHKGDSGNGLFIQLTQENFWDVDIPDEIGKNKSSLTFGTLQAAQAQGDWQALKEEGRRIIRFHFRTNSVAGLKNLTEIL